jgi:hypothetical protein
MDDEIIQLFNHTFRQKDNKSPFLQYKEFAQKHQLDLSLFINAMLEPEINHNNNIHKFFNSINEKHKMDTIWYFICYRACINEKRVADIMGAISYQYNKLQGMHYFDIQPKFHIQPLYKQHYNEICDEINRGLCEYLLQQFGFWKCIRSVIDAKAFIQLLFGNPDDENVYLPLLQKYGRNGIDGVTNITNYHFHTHCFHCHQPASDFHNYIMDAIPRIKICRCLLKMNVEMETATIIENRAMLIIADIYILKTMMGFL